MSKDELSRRILLVSTSAAGLATLAGAQEKSKKKGKDEEEVSPAEDLMREHGVLKRILLIYREVMNRIDSKRDFPPEVVMSSAKLIRTCVEDYHAKLEEDYATAAASKRPRTD